MKAFWSFFRLTRLIRIVRVAALVPRVAALVSATVTHDDIEKLLDKKFQRIFHHLAEENDQVMARSTALHCKSRIRPHRMMKRNAFKSVLRFFSCPGVPRAPSEKSDDDDSKADFGCGSQDGHQKCLSQTDRHLSHGRETYTCAHRAQQCTQTMGSRFLAS